MFKFLLTIIVMWNLYKYYQNMYIFKFQFKTVNLEYSTQIVYENQQANFRPTFCFITGIFFTEMLNSPLRIYLFCCPTISMVQPVSL